MDNKYDLKQLHYRDLKNNKFEIAILPWGATEAHNYHLPYGTDNYEVTVIANKSAEIASEYGAEVLVLPHIPYGVNTGQTDIPYVMNMMPSTQKLIIEDITESLQRSGVNKLLILNGHGGNDFKAIIRETLHKFPDMCICSANWFEALDHEQYFNYPGEHADEMETSLMLHLYPELVLDLDEAGNGQNKKFTVQGLNEKWAWTERKWSSVSNDTGIGNPAHSTAEKGETFFNDLCQKLGRFIYDLAITPLNKFYQY
ncbi:MAG: creatininase family protein [Chlorobi bacterium]|nr:creatininase family protein [Chlorobiota bacterium]